MRSLENMTYKEGLKKLASFSLGKRSLRRGMINVFHYIKGCYTEDSDQLVSIATQGRTRRNQLNLQQRRFILDIKRNF